MEAQYLLSMDLFVSSEASCAVEDVSILTLLPSCNGRRIGNSGLFGRNGINVCSEIICTFRF